MKNLVVALLVIVLLAITPNLFAQNVSINADGSLADTSAMLDISSTTKGVLLPRMTTTQQNSIILPANGLTIFNTTLNSIMINTGTTLSPVWSGLTAGAIDTSSIANFSVKIRSLFSGVAPILYSNGSIGITQSGSSTNGYLSSTDWNTFNTKGNGSVTNVTATAPLSIIGTSSVTPNVVADTSKSAGKLATFSDVALKQNLVTLTTTGSSGAATFNQGTGALNIPAYGAGTGTVTSVAKGYGMVADGTITTTGTVTVDSAALHLKFLGLKDSTIYYPYVSNPKGYLTANQNITVTATGDATGTSTGSPASPSLPLTLATVNSSIGSFTNANITVNGKGLITAASNGTAGTVTNILTGYGLSGGPITSTGTIIVDSTTLHLKFLALKDSVNSITGYTTLYQHNLKQNQLNGTGFIKATGTTITYDNSTYLTAAVTSISQAYGIINTPNPIISTGTIAVDTAALHLKFLGIKDSSTYTTVYQNSLKQNLITLTTTGTSGSSTFNQSTGALNIPTYAAGTGTVTNVTATAPLSITGTSTLTPNVKADTTTAITGLATQYDVSLKGRVDSVRLVGSSVFHSSPAAFSLSGNTAVVTQSLLTQSANTVLAGPASGSAATPTFRSIVPLDLGTAPTAGKVLHGDGTWKDTTVATSPTNLWSITGNSGTSYLTNFLGTTDKISLRFRTNNVQRMIIDSSLGNVGIGTSAFDATVPEKLLVDAGTNPYNGVYTPLTPINAVGFTNGYQQIQVQNKGYGNYSSSDLVAANDGTRAGTVPYNTDAYYVDLGINSSGYLNSNSNILNHPYTSYLYATSPADFYIGNGYGSKDIVFFTNYGATNTNNTADGIELMRLIGGTNAATQQVTIGTPNPNGTNKLTVSGSISASAFNVSSDRRLKTNITSLRYGLKEVLALQPVSYNWKKSPATDKQLGLIAQDAKKEIPELVSGNEKTGTLSINYTELVPVLINAIKEQQQQIDSLKKDIELLKNRKGN